MAMKRYIVMVAVTVEADDDAQASELVEDAIWPTFGREAVVTTVTHHFQQELKDQP